MASRFWRGLVSTDWNNTGNWSATSGGVTGVSVPVSVDTATFDGNSNTNGCALSSAIVVGRITFNSSFTNSFTSNGNAISTVDNGIGVGLACYGGGNINLSGSVINTELIAFQNTGSLNLSNCNITCAGSYYIYATQTSLSQANLMITIKKTSNVGAGSISNCTFRQLEMSTDPIKSIYVNREVFVDVRNGMTTGGYSFQILLRNDGGTSLELQDDTATVSLNGSGLTVLSTGTCQPLKANGGLFTATTGWSYKFECNATANIDLPQIGRTSTFALKQSNVAFTVVDLIATSDADVTFNFTGDIICRTFRIRTLTVSVTGGKKLTCNTMGFSLFTTRLDFEQNYNTADLHELVFNNGSNAPIVNEATNTFANVVYFLGTATNAAAITFAQLAGKVTTLNFHASTWKVTNNGASITWQYGNSLGTINVNAGTSTLILGDRTVAPVQQSITFYSRGKTFYNIKIDMDSASFPALILDMLRCNRLLIEAGTTCSFIKDVYNEVASYVDGDWDGTTSKYVKLRTSAENNSHYFLFASAPAKFYVKYVDVKDAVCLTHVVNAWSVPNGGTNIDSGNNFNWVFNIPQVLFSAFWARQCNVIIQEIR